MAVCAVDLLDARAHEAAQLEQRHACRDRERREGVPQRVRRAWAAGTTCGGYERISGRSCLLLLAVTLGPTAVLALVFYGPL
jgi:hypothetical protein